jgi:hypothetical protein
MVVLGFEWTACVVVGKTGKPWLELMWRDQLHFLMRWKKGHHFLDEHGQEKS